MLPANRSKDTYWWADEDSKAVVDQLESTGWTNAGYTSGTMRMAWSRNVMFYFSTLMKSENWDTGLNFAGTQGELVEMMVPMARSLIRQLVSIVTKQRLAFSVLAETTSEGTIQAARLGSALCKQIVREQQLDIVYENMYEHSLLTGLGFLYTQWRTDLGEYYTTDKMGQKHFTGNLEISTPTVWDVDFDASIPDPKDWQWVKVRRIHNRWDLASQFPDQQEEIIKLPSIREVEGRFTADNQTSPSDDDNVYIYAAYHKKSPSMPVGRMIVYGSDKCVLVDDKNHYGKLPIYVARAEPIPGSSYGYPFISSLLPLQEMLDNTLSSIATNNSQFGVQNVSAPRGSNVTSEQINGMNFLYFTPMDGGGGEPKSLQLTSSAPEAWKFIDVLKAMLLDQSMINSALRGDPPTGVTSGAAIATLTTTALESVASSSKAARDCLRRCMKGSFEVYRIFASVDRDIQMDNGNQISVDKFKGEDLDGIKDIDIVENNPLMQTQAGRDQMADKLFQMGAITNTKGYFAVQEGAPVSELYQNELTEEDLVKRENDDLINGQAVLVTNIDDHAYHIMMHAIPLKDQNVRRNKAFVKQITDHILEHYQQASQMDPAFAAMVRTGKIPEGAFMPPPMPGPAGAGGPPPGKAPGGNNPASPEGGKPAKPANPAPDLLGRTAPVKGVA